MVNRIPFGDANDMYPGGRGMTHCPDCGVLVGQYHHFGCDIERCPVHAPRQLLNCDCFYDFEDELETSAKNENKPIILTSLEGEEIEYKTLLQIVDDHDKVIWVESRSDQALIFNNDAEVHFSWIDGYRIINVAMKNHDFIGVTRTSLSYYVSNVTIARIGNTWSIIAGFSDTPTNEKCIGCSIQMSEPAEIWHKKNFDIDKLNQVKNMIGRKEEKREDA